jgi:tetratricopeptide (TPR) repeat protein
MATPHHQRHLTRKELRQPDEFESFIGTARVFVSQNLTQVLISAGIVAAVGAIVLGVYSYERHRDRAAGAAFYQALGELNTRDFKTAQEGFAKLADDEPGLRLGRLSRFYLALAYLGLDDLPHARDTLTLFLSEEHEPMFVNLALADLGVVYERQGDFKKAAVSYASAGRVAGPEQLAAEIGVARMLEKAGDRKSAISAYRAFLASHPFAAQRNDVIESLAILGAGPEAAGKPAAKPVAPVMMPAPAH